MDRQIKNFNIKRSYIRNFLRLNPEHPCGWLIYSRYERNFGNYRISKKVLFFIIKYNKIWLNYFFLESQKFFLNKQKFFSSVFKIDKSNLKSWVLLITNKQKIYWKKKLILSALYFFPDVNFLWTIGEIIFGFEFLNKTLFNIGKKSKVFKNFFSFFSYKNGKVITFKKIIPVIFFSNIFHNKYFLFTNFKKKFIKKQDEILSLIHEKILKKKKSFFLQKSKNRKYSNEQDIFLEIFFFRKKKKNEFKKIKIFIFEFLIKVSKNIIKFLIYLNTKSYFFFYYFINKNLFSNKNFLLIYLNLKNENGNGKNILIENKLFKEKQNFKNIYYNGLFEKKKENFHIYIFQK